jgi:DNA helicase-2/ATP-dependent DNA helicase PcrA
MTWRIGLDDNSPAFLFASATHDLIRTVAGPGTGKSFAIKRRIARLLQEGIQPTSILAVTFTRTASADLKREIGSISVEGADSVAAKTLHSLCLEILMREDVLPNLDRVPRLLVNHEIKPILRDLDTDNYGDIRQKEKRIIAYQAAWARLQHDDAGSAQDPIDQEFEEELIGWLKQHECMLIGEVIPISLQFLRDNPHSAVYDKYQIILVDEYQDLNKAEQALIKTLAIGKSFVIVGDDDQSIYSFKHAHPEGIREVVIDYPNCHTVNFDVCRRCPTNIVGFANSLIRNNRDRTLGQLQPFNGNCEGQVHIIQWQDLEQELEGLVTTIKSELTSGRISEKDILVLAPRRRIGYDLRDKLLRENLSAKSYFREDALSSDKVRKAYSMLSFLANKDQLSALRYLIGCESSSFLKNQYKKVRQEAIARGLNIRSLLEMIKDGAVKLSGVKNVVKNYQNLLEKTAELKEAIIESSENVVNFFIERDDELIDFYELKQVYDESIIAIEALDVPENFDTWYKNLFNELSTRILMPETPQDVDHIRIMSLHSAKGLSAPCVIIVTATTELLNHIDKVATENEARRIREEQRRLFYVAITR